MRQVPNLVQKTALKHVICHVTNVNCRRMRLRPGQRLRCSSPTPSPRESSSSSEYNLRVVSTQQLIRSIEKEEVILLSEGFAIVTVLVQFVSGRKQEACSSH